MSLRLIAALFFSLCIPFTVIAEPWVTALKDMPQAPARLVSVNKSSQELFVIGRQSPMQVIDKYTCTTGQVTGDKVLEGDLKTPEGIYFVTRKISQGLDFAEYGGIAYTLNYPNPIDRLREKTGHGIWIHSRGEPITPLETRGCIAVDLEDIAKLGPELSLGLPVVVAEQYATDADKSSDADRKIAKLLEDKTKDWNLAWASRSKKMFDFYDANLYSKAQQESFNAFKAQKERLFARFNWIHIIYRDVYVMQGPGYWVTWFDQYYKAPNLTTEGVRRLYWQADDEGELRIVGMEWIPKDVGLESSYLQTVTPSVTNFIENWKKHWLKADIEKYMACYASDAEQGKIRGVKNISASKKSLWKRAKPKKVDLTGFRITADQDGVKVDMTQSYVDSTGFKDKGVKTLILQPKGDSWVIAKDMWSPLK